MSRLLAILLFAAMLFATGLHAQHLDFGRVFPPEEQQWSDYRAALARFDALRGHVADDPAEAAARFDALERAVQRLDAYLYLRAAVDTTNARAKEAEETLSAEYDQHTAFFAAEAAKVPESRVPARYRWFFAVAREQAKHRLAQAQEDVVATLEPFTTTWQADLKDRLDASAASAADKRELYAFSLVALARARNAVAKLRGYDDAASEVYARSGLAKADVTRLLDALAREAERYKQYAAMRAAHADVAVAPKFTFDEVRAILPRALAPNGAEYVTELNALLDPANGRFDAGPGEHRRRGGFSKGFPGFPSVFFMPAFNGTFNDMRVVAHESTHALQSELEGRRGVAPVSIAGQPKFLAETFAMFNELLLPAWLADREQDPARKAFFLEQFLESKGMGIVFVTAAEAALEQELYDGVAAGTIRDADAIDALAQRVGARYLPRELKWTNVRLMWDDPFYDVNYTLAGLLSLALYARYVRDPNAFLPAYRTLFASGAVDAPDVLLRRAGIDIHDARWVTDALDSVQGRIDELKAIYAARSR
ncbi:MAG: M3 family oligoendopeptidase [Acidobacteria bacterium]|nr:M3 family oligoendopeptidase [Acidobacteriota bacterium]MBV9475700.1 M3 family oligoendopeptidase [Acidobacteriota bacterium]